MKRNPTPLTINSSGESPVTGETTARVWIEEEQPKRYVRRHYEIFPETGDPDVLSGEVTIYFTQEEFDDYNKEITARDLKAEIRKW